MAISLLNHVVEDLCLGKPALKSLSISSATTVGDALSALKSSSENFISIWSCSKNANNHDHNNKGIILSCKCVGKISMVDIICFLCKQENLTSPASALLSPVSSILSNNTDLVQHVDPSTGLLDAIDLILQGAQNLIVPIHSIISPYSRRKQQIKVVSNSGSALHNGCEYCWLTQEDVVQFLLSRIGLLTPIPNMSVESLGIIQTEILTVGYHTPASVALDVIAQSLVDQTSVGVVDEHGALVGELSPFTLAYCDESVAAAIMALSCGDLMAYIDWGGPPEEIVRAIKARLMEKKLDGLLEMLDDEYSSSSSFLGSTSSSDDDESSMSSSPTRKLIHHKSGSYSARMVRKAEAIVCHPKSSLVAVMIQAIAHRVNYVWVMEDDCILVGIVTFRKMLEVMQEHLHSMVDELDA